MILEGFITESISLYEINQHNTKSRANVRSMKHSRERSLYETLTRTFALWTHNGEIPVKVQVTPSLPPPHSSRVTTSLLLPGVTEV